MKKTRRKEPNRLISIVLIIAFIMIVLLIVKTILKITGPKANIEVNNTYNASVVLTKEEIQESNNEDEINLLRNLNERNRIERYVTKFINFVEKGKYEEAYSLLNKEYKENYFPTESSFRDYMKENFSTMMDVKFTNIERNGDIYVSWATITDSINGTKDGGKEFTFVVKENDYNDFELSFSKN